MKIYYYIIVLLGLVSCTDQSIKNESSGITTTEISSTDEVYALNEGEGIISKNIDSKISVEDAIALVKGEHEIVSRYKLHVSSFDESEIRSSLDDNLLVEINKLPLDSVEIIIKSISKKKL